jgi:hypothetical protein
MAKLVIIPIWVAISILNAGFINASFRMQWPDLYQSPVAAADGRNFALLWSLFPPCWVITPFVSGFYSRGWTLDGSAFPCTASNPDIWCKP